MDFGQIFGFIFPFLEHVPVLRAILGFILVFFLPGFAWTLVFFSKVTIVERLALSFGLSIAIVTISIIILNVLLDVKITGGNALFIIFFLVIIPLAIYYLRRFLGSRPPEQD